MRLKTFIVTLLAAALTAAAPATAAASSVPVQGSSAAAGALVPRGTTVNQGDEVLSFRGLVWNSCTIGYVDRGARVGYTASHCVYPGEPVFDANMQLIGFVEASNIFGLNSGATDVAKIRFADGVTMGANAHSGDARVPHHDVRPGEEVCVWGFAVKRPVCGQVTDTNARKEIHAHLPGIGVGDSGGPAWIPGRGFVGVISGADNANPQGVIRERIASVDGL